MEYVVCDIHGEKELYEYGLKKVGFDKEKDHLYVIGDVIDRGKDGIKLLLEFMSNPSADLTLGNHEYMMLNSVDPEGSIALTGDKSRIWTDYNGGSKTYSQWVNLLRKERLEILSFLRKCYISKTVMVQDTEGKEHPYILTHSAYDEDLNDLTYDEAVAEFGLEAVESHVWNSIYRTGDTKGIDNYYKRINDEQVTFITGHVPVQKARLFLHQDKDFGNLTPLYLENRMIDIDGGAAWGKQRGMMNGLIFYNMTTREAVPVSFYEMRKNK